VIIDLPGAVNGLLFTLLLVWLFRPLKPVPEGAPQ